MRMSIVLPDSSNLLFPPTVRLQKGSSFTATALLYRNGKHFNFSNRKRDSSFVKFHQNDHTNNRVNSNKGASLSVRQTEDFGNY